MPYSEPLPIARRDSLTGFNRRSKQFSKSWEMLYHNPAFVFQSRKNQYGSIYLALPHDQPFFFLYTLFGDTTDMHCQTSTYYQAVL